MPPHGSGRSGGGEPKSHVERNREYTGGWQLIFLNLYFMLSFPFSPPFSQNTSDTVCLVGYSLSCYLILDALQVNGF